MQGEGDNEMQELNSKKAASGGKTVNWTLRCRTNEEISDVYIY